MVGRTLLIHSAVGLGLSFGDLALAVVAGTSADVVVVSLILAGLALGALLGRGGHNLGVALADGRMALALVLIESRWATKEGLYVVLGHRAGHAGHACAGLGEAVDLSTHTLIGGTRLGTTEVVSEQFRGTGGTLLCNAGTQFAVGFGKLALAVGSSDVVTVGASRDLALGFASMAADEYLFGRGIGLGEAFDDSAPALKRRLVEAIPIARSNECQS